MPESRRQPADAEHHQSRPQLFGGIQVPLYAYYAPQLWRIDQYVKWQADALENARRGVVRVGAVDEAG